jgi:hypothetical protein
VGLCGDGHHGGGDLLGAAQRGCQPAPAAPHSGAFPLIFRKSWNAGHKWGLTILITAHNGDFPVFVLQLLCTFWLLKVF